MKKKLMLILILLLSMFLVSCNIEDNTLEVEQEFSKYESQNDAVILIAESIIYFNTHKLDLNELLKNKEEKLNGGYIITKDKVYFTSAAPNVVELFNFTFYTYECDIYGKNLKKLLEVSNIPTLPSCVANDFCFYVEYYTEDALNEDSRRIDVYDLNTQEYKILERGKECSLSKYRPKEKNSYSVELIDKPYLPIVKDNSYFKIINKETKEERIINKEYIENTIYSESLLKYNYQTKRIDVSDDHIYITYQLKAGNGMNFCFVLFEYDFESRTITYKQLSFLDVDVLIDIIYLV